MKGYEELRYLAQKLRDAAESLNDYLPLFDALEVEAKDVGRAFSGSWLGYHANVYYEGLAAPPAGANFSQEWGLKNLGGRLGSRGKWVQHVPEEVTTAIYEAAGNPELDAARDAQEKVNSCFDSLKSEMLSVLQQELDGKPDEFLGKLKDEVARLGTMSRHNFEARAEPKGEIFTRDMLALGQGSIVPPHFAIIADVATLRHSGDICSRAANIGIQAASHLERKEKRMVKLDRIGTNVFIGHGRSPLWREVKDFVHARLKLPWDEFNRVPVAGITNIARLSEMLDAAAIAFLVMTAEDEMADGGLQARMNVVHEAGLFQGRLGFTRAIVLLEDGCTEFSNINGLGQIRFPKGNIKAVFDDLRAVLEREGLIEP